LTGGTGLAPRDVTPEAVEPLLDRALPGFGERFRALSAREVGSAAWLSRAGAGVARGRLVVYLPGSSGAVRQALDELLIPELAHAVRLFERFCPRYDSDRPTILTVYDSDQERACRSVPTTGS